MAVSTEAATNPGHSMTLGRESDTSVDFVRLLDRESVPRRSPIASHITDPYGTASRSYGCRYLRGC